MRQTSQKLYDVMKKSSFNKEMKLKLQKRLSTLMYSFIFISMFVVVPLSCSKNDDSIGISEVLYKNMEYLDTDGSNLSALTEQQKVILDKARTRIDSFVVYEKKAYILKVSHGSQIQMSERLFAFFKAKMVQTNALIKNLNVVVDNKDPKRLRVINKSDLHSNIRLKIANVEGEDPPQNTDGWNLRWDGIDIYISSHTLNVWAAENAGAAALFAWFPEPLVSKIAMTVYGLAGIGWAYLAAEHPNGLMITINWIE